MNLIQTKFQNLQKQLNEINHLFESINKLKIEQTIDASTRPHSIETLKVKSEKSDRNKLSDQNYNQQQLCHNLNLNYEYQKSNSADKLKNKTKSEFNDSFVQRKRISAIQINITNHANDSEIKQYDFKIKPIDLDNDIEFSNMDDFKEDIDNLNTKNIQYHTKMNTNHLNTGQVSYIDMDSEFEYPFNERRFSKPALSDIQESKLTNNTLLQSTRQSHGQEPNNLLNGSNDGLNRLKLDDISSNNSSLRKNRMHKVSVNEQNSVQLKDDKLYEKIKNQNIDMQSVMNIIFENNESLSIVKIENIHISEESAFTYLWNLVITIILCFQILSFPLENFSEPWLIQKDWYIIMNLIFEQLIIMDIIINFFTSQVDKQGKNIKNTYQIAHHYFKTWFILDLASSIPTNNLEQFNVITIEKFNVQLRILKLPRQFRVLKGFMKLLESKFSSIFDSATLNSFSKSEKRFINASKYLLSLLLLSHIFSCMFIAYAPKCVNNDCINWFMALMQDEFEQAVRSPSSPLHNVALNMAELQGTDAALNFQNQVQDHYRHYLYYDAWQFVIQTVTTVGQGDVGTQSNDERTLRSACIVIGVVNFSLLQANFMEYIISETMNVFKKNEHLGMIEKLVLKQNIGGEARRFLQLLGDSVYNEQTQEEIEFVNKLPHQMSEMVLLSIYNEYKTRITLLHEESIDFFKKMMQVASFRRCITEENVGFDKDKIGIVYSGQVGVKAANVSYYLGDEYLYHMGIGEEVGQNNMIVVHTLQSYVCIVNTELIEIGLSEQISLVKRSFKGLDQVQQRLVGQVIDVFMVVCLQYAMMKMGLQIDQKWQKQVVSSFNFTPSDQDVMDKLQSHFTSNSIRSDKKFKKVPGLEGKWYDQVLDADLYKQIMNKCQQRLPYMIPTKLRVIFDQVKSRHRMRLKSSNSNMQTK